MKNLRAIAAGLFSLLICIPAQAQSKSGWTDHNCKKDPFTSQVNCSMVVLESLPAKSGSVPGALFAWIISKENGRVLILFSLSTFDEPKMIKERDNEKAIEPILVRVDDSPIHTIKPSSIVLSVKQAPPYRQMFEISDDLLQQLAKGEKVFLRFDSKDGSTITKEFPLKGTAEKLYAMMSQFTEMVPKESK